MSQCDAFGLQQAEAAEEVVRIIGTVDTWQTHFAHAGVTRHDIDHLAARIDGDALLHQRRSFDAGRYASAAPRRRRTGPFRRPGG